MLLPLCCIASLNTSFEIAVTFSRNIPMSSTCGVYKSVLLIVVHKKWSFRLRISSVNVTKSAGIRNFSVLKMACAYNFFAWRPHDVQYFLRCISTSQHPQNNDPRSIVTFLSNGYTLHKSCIVKLELKWKYYRTNTYSHTSSNKDKRKNRTNFISFIL